jgi:hypothetical protein
MLNCFAQFFKSINNGLLESDFLGRKVPIERAGGHTRFFSESIDPNSFIAVLAKSSAHGG